VEKVKDSSVFFVFGRVLRVAHFIPTSWAALSRRRSLIRHAWACPRRC